MINITGPPRLARPPRLRPCLDFAELKAVAAAAACRWCGRHCGGLAWQKMTVVALIIRCFSQNEFIFHFQTYHLLLQLQFENRRSREFIFSIIVNQCKAIFSSFIAKVWQKMVGEGKNTDHNLTWKYWECDCALPILQFRFSKKTTKNHEISQLIWRLFSKFQINWEISDFGSLRKLELGKLA